MAGTVAGTGTVAVAVTGTVTVAVAVTVTVTVTVAGAVEGVGAENVAVRLGTAHSFEGFRKVPLLRARDRIFQPSKEIR